VHTELVNDERLTAIGLFAEAYEGLAARFAAQLAEHHLAPIEFEVLMRLARSPDGQLRMTDLSAQTTLTTSGVTRVIDRLNRAIIQSVKASEFNERLAGVGAHAVGSTPGEFADFVKKELASWSKVIKATGIRIE